MTNYRVNYVSLESRYTSIHEYPSIETALYAVSQLMLTAKEKYRIIINIKSNG